MHMVALVGGVAALVLGIIGLVGWWSDFIDLLKGAIPVILLLGGALVTYLGVEELKDKRRAEVEASRDTFSAPTEGGDVDKYKAEVAELKAKLAAMEEKDTPAASEEADKPQD
jgi:hypothetical protein